MRVLVTGGAGFIGGNTAVALAARHPDWELIAFDNLHRRGSELNLGRLAAAGIRFVHGDIRLLEDLLEIGELDVMLECSAEPSAIAGFDGSPDYVIKTNLLGAYNCLELARRRDAYLVFLSTSRVYPIAALRGLRLVETDTRFELADDQPIPGASREGISESFPLDGSRTLYGSTKLSAELLISEYRDAYGLRAVIDRCGVITGPWQMGKVDQGVFTFWLLAHHFGRPLSYIGFDGTGKQVRDLLHVEDLTDLLDEQINNPEEWDGVCANVGGGRERSLSLHETTELCAELTGRRTEISRATEDRPGDVPSYISDCRALFARTAWRPRRTPRETLAEIHAWILDHEVELERTL